MNETPLISVVVPAYNVEKYIKACLDSILEQTYPNFEIIVINDGSTDKTKMILKKYSNEERIRCYSQKNSGLSVARNQGIKMSKGEFICFIDSDDYIAYNYLDKMFAPFMLDSEVDIVVCGYQEIYQNSIKNHDLKQKTLTGHNATKNLLINQQDFDVIAWNKLYRKKLFVDHQIFYPIGQIHEDNLTTYKLFSVAQKVSYVKDTLYFYQRKNSQITKNLHSHEKTLKRLSAKEQMAIEAKQFLRHPELKKASDIALILAYFSFMDNSISGWIDRKYFEIYRRKLFIYLKSQCKNPLLTQKLKLYLILVSSPMGVLYYIFRKITLKNINKD